MQWQDYGYLSGCGTMAPFGWYQLYHLVTQANECEQLAWSCYMEVERLGFGHAVAEIRRGKKRKKEDRNHRAKI